MRIHMRMPAAEVSPGIVCYGKSRKRFTGEREGPPRSENGGMVVLNYF